MTPAIAHSVHQNQVASSLLEERHGWQRIISAGAEFWFKGYLFGDTWRELADRIAGGAEAGRKAVAAADGHFGLIYIAEEWCLAATDRIGSIPLSFARRDDTWIIGSEARQVASAAGCRDHNMDAVLAIGMAGYTIGWDTIFSGLFALDPGECVVLTKNLEPDRRHYFVYAPRPVPANGNAERLTEILRHIFEKTAASLDGRTVIVPLSAGLDSRLIVTGLREVGYQHVKCFSYGQHGNHEATAARQISDALGCPWAFIPHTPHQQQTTFKSDAGRDFVAFADTLQAIPFQQDFHAVGTLKANGFAPEEAIFINGQSGDFISGNHIPPSLQGLEDESSADRWVRIVDAALAKHFDLWAILKTPKRTERIAELLRRDLVRCGLDPENNLPDFALFEGSECKNRQSKYVVAGQRTYEWHGFEWRLPLWDNAFMDFWQTTPLSEKVGQTLFTETLKKMNWGGVWGPEYWPRRNITPGWIGLPRFLAKLCYAPVGRAAWHAFERRYIAWRTDTVCNYAIAPYVRVARDSRGHRNAISWHVDHYLAEKGLNLDGSPIVGTA
jgi:asparagine synthase (glutamine-hydrolysing)